MANAKFSLADFAADILMQRSFADLMYILDCSDLALSEVIADEAVLSYALVSPESRLDFRDFLLSSGATAKFRELLKKRLIQRDEVISAELQVFNGFRLSDF